MSERLDGYDQCDELMAAIAEKVNQNIRGSALIGEVGVMRLAFQFGHEAWDAWSELTGDGSAWYPRLKAAQVKHFALLFTRPRACQ